MAGRVGFRHRVRRLCLRYVSGTRRSGVPKVWSRVTGLGTGGRFIIACAAVTAMFAGSIATALLVFRPVR